MWLQVSWQALVFIQQRQSDGKLKLADFTADMVPLQLAALGRPADSDLRAGQRRMQLVQLLQMQARNAELLRIAVWQKCDVPLLQRGT